MPDPLSILPVAHAGHWAVWVLYALPVVAVVVAIRVSSRRAPDDEPGDEGEGEDLL